MLLKLLTGCRRADRECQHQLYLLYYGYCISIALRYTRTRDEAMEAVNDGFMKAFEDIGRFDPTLHELAGSFRGWLRKIMLRTAIDYYRRMEKHAHNQELDASAYTLPDDGGNALDALSYQELLALIQQLSPAYRTVFNLFVIDGFSHEEIAQQLGISVGTSKSNLSKARAHLRFFLQPNNSHAYVGRPLG